MELEGSLPCSQEPSIGPCPEPDETNPHPYTFFVRPILILSSIHAQVIRLVSYLWAFQPKFCTHFSSPPCALHAPPLVLFVLIILIIYRLTKSHDTIPYEDSNELLCPISLKTRIRSHWHVINFSVTWNTDNTLSQAAYLLRTSLYLSGLHCFSEKIVWASVQKTRLWFTSRQEQECSHGCWWSGTKTVKTFANVPCELIRGSCVEWS
jgi:hypothetical protein